MWLVVPPASAHALRECGLAQQRGLRRPRCAVVAWRDDAWCAGGDAAFADVAVSLLPVAPRVPPIPAWCGGLGVGASVEVALVVNARAPWRGGNNVGSSGVGGSGSAAAAAGGGAVAWPCRVCAEARAPADVGRCGGCGRVLCALEPAAWGCEVDHAGGRRLIALENKHVTLQTANALVSTLGGGHFLCRQVSAAMAMARRQMWIARELGDAKLLLRCHVHLAYCLIQVGAFGSAVRLLRHINTAATALEDGVCAGMVTAARRHARKTHELWRQGALSFDFEDASWSLVARPGAGERRGLGAGVAPRSPHGAVLRQHADGGGGAASLVIASAIASPTPRTGGARGASVVLAAADVGATPSGVRASAEGGDERRAAGDAVCVGSGATTWAGSPVAARPTHGIGGLGSVSAGGAVVVAPSDLAPAAVACGGGTGAADGDGIDGVPAATASGGEACASAPGDAQPPRPSAALSRTDELYRLRLVRLQPPR